MKNRTGPEARASQLCLTGRFGLSPSGATTWSGHGGHIAPPDGASQPLVHNLVRLIHRAVTPGRPAPVAGA